MKNNNNKGITLMEVVITTATLGLIILPIIKVQSLANNSALKIQQMRNLQNLAQNSLTNISREVRQAIKITEITPNVNSNQVAIFVPKLNNSGDIAIADKIFYSTGTYQGISNRLLQELTTYDRDLSGNVIQTGNFQNIPISVLMDYYRKLSGGNQYDGEIGSLFNDERYKYEDVTFYWDDTNNTLAIGISLSATYRDVETYLSLTTVVKPRKEL